MRGTINKVAQFLGKTLTECQKTELETHLSFENFQKNATLNLEYLRDLHITKAEEQGFIRKGNLSKKEKEFSPELNEQADNWIEENMKKLNIMFPNV